MDQATIDLGKQIAKKRGELAEIFTKNKTAEGLKLTPEQIKEVNQRETELEGMVADYNTKRKMAEIEEKNSAALAEMKSAGPRLPFGGHPKGGPEEPGTDYKSLGDLLVESKAYKEVSGRKGPTVEVATSDLKSYLAGVNYKAVLENTQASGAGYAPQSLRSGALIYSPQPQPTLLDLVPQTETQYSVYKWMLETVYTNAAAEAAEGALAGEGSLRFDEQDSSIVKIPVFIPITEEQLADVNGLRDIVNTRLALMIRQRINAQIVSGNGNSPNIQGIINTPNVLTQNLGTDIAPDCIYKSMIQVMTVGFADPSGIWMNPLNWQAIRLLKTTTGAYIYGDPSQQGPNTIFGLPVAIHVNVTQGTGVVADFLTYTGIVYRNGIEFAISDSHADFFQRGQLAIRAMVRLTFVVYRPQAVCLAQGLPS